MFPADRKRVEAALSACHLAKGKVSSSPPPVNLLILAPTRKQQQQLQQQQQHGQG